MLSKKDYKMIAEVIALKVPDVAKDQVIAAFADRLSQDNPRFDKVIFRNYVVKIYESKEA